MPRRHSCRQATLTVAKVETFPLQIWLCVCFSIHNGFILAFERQRFQFYIFCLFCSGTWMKTELSMYPQRYPGGALGGEECVCSEQESFKIWVWEGEWQELLATVSQNLAKFQWEGVWVFCKLQDVPFHLLTLEEEVVTRQPRGTTFWGGGEASSLLFPEGQGMPPQWGWETWKESD